MATRDEAKRLEVLERLAILDTPQEALYQDAAMLAARICGTPMAIISLISKDRQWFKARIGIDVTETSREKAFCGFTILHEEPTVVENALNDPRFAGNEMVTGPFHLRFYAGVPVVADTCAVGTLCVMSREPQTLTASQLDSLEALGRHVSAILEQRLLLSKVTAQNARLESANEMANDLAQKLVHSSERFENLFQGLPVACMTLDTDGRVMEWNKKCTDVYGYESWEAFGKNVFDLVVYKEDRAAIDEAFARSIVRVGTAEPAEYKVSHKDGTPVWVLSRSVPLHDASGNLVGLISSNVDITARKLAEAALKESHDLIDAQRTMLEVANSRLEKLAMSDGLTGLNNHRTFQEFLRTEFSVAVTHHSPLSMILFDIDHFKSLNDNFGHPAGDAVLKGMAVLLDSCTTSSSLVARYGGEEFVVVLPGADQAEALAAADKIRLAVCEADWPHRQVTASFGVATYSTNLTCPGDLIQHADEAMYRSKAAGRNRVTVFEEESLQTLAS